MDDCIFCKIAKKEIQVKAILNTEKALAFLDINPIAPGHCVIIPKKHIPTLLQAEDNDILSVFSAAKQVAEMIKTGLKCDGFNIGLNQEKAAGQAIPHLHIHIIPRFNGDGGGSMHTIVRNPPKENLDEIYRKITSNEKQVEPLHVSEPKTEKKPADERQRLRDFELDL
jgi:histidine triad (HIT) family protein